MTVRYDNISTRFLELLNSHNEVRLKHFPQFFDHCSTRDLSDLFPILVRSVFGLENNLEGWGLRIALEQPPTDNYKLLCEFFGVKGPMFQIIYRLLDDCYKFEFDVQLLPRKFLVMLQSGHYPPFYNDILCIDSFQHTVAGFSLNAFDFYILHFVLHTLRPLHRKYATALFEAEDVKTAYLFLTNAYLKNFLPPYPNDEVQPTNIAPAVKMAQPLPCQPIQPMRQPRFINASRLFNNNANVTQVDAVNQLVIVNAEKARSQTWRTESTIFFFLDSLLSVDVAGTVEMPGSEYVRVLQTFIIAVHAFGSAAPIESSSMLGLRKIVQPMIKTRFYPFLNTLLNRWPLDSSMNLLLGLWLAYIQPWKYSRQDNIQGGQQRNLPLGNYYDAFISENLLFYTHVFVQMLPRFNALDYRDPRNIRMLNRQLKAFTKESLPDRLRLYEQMLTKNDINFDSLQRHMHLSNAIGSDTAVLQRSTYTPMFTPEVEEIVSGLLAQLYDTRYNLLLEKHARRSDDHTKINPGLWMIEQLINTFHWECHETNSGESHQGNPIRELEEAIKMLCGLFNIPLPNFEVSLNQLSMHADSTHSSINNSNHLESSSLSMKHYASIDNLPPSTDPALVPVRSNEFPLAVTVLGIIASVINDKFGDQLRMYYGENSLRGKFLQLVLYPPVTIQRFEKRYGLKTLREYDMPPRLCLRALASYAALITLPLVMLLSYLIFGSPMTGLFLLVLFYCVYTTLLSCVLKQV